ncbi:IS5/IS1182 family transposase, partial [Pectobacterium betavasculorum]
IDSIFALMGIPLRCPDYTSVSKRAKSFDVSFKTPSRGEIAHLAVDAKTHEIICADLSLNNVTDAEAFPGLIRQTHRKIKSAA